MLKKLHVPGFHLPRRHSDASDDESSLSSPSPPQLQPIASNRGGGASPRPQGGAASPPPQGARLSLTEQLELLQEEQSALMDHLADNPDDIECL
eukprot:COSAG04_NODE_1890_length_5298_cov_7.441239_4_plen_94_part_00